MIRKLTPERPGGAPPFFLRPGVGYSTEPAAVIGEGVAWVGQVDAVRAASLGLDAIS